ncbi:NAD-dependent protein deacylase 2 [Symbiodinium microadriaticum]|uniref:NAD-dependent protein deacylase 2 n=1 Tax=Symbiodinium microadriaticum TaxID=2951 RepID=A0A1Q9DY51_SYMMI|nr:NAD-dependent protein deacylase 2 [Symbiodinium microadriaticum]
MLLVGQTLAFTGAGISKESGVPTYRDGDGLWKRYDAMEVSSISGLAGQPSKVWAFEREFYDILQRCQGLAFGGPNPGHRALAALEESGVPTYRDGDGLWKRYDAMEVSSISGLAGQPSKVWAFEREFYDILQRCQGLAFGGPNPGHRALAALEDMVVTQNVDGFHQAAGSKVVELHGSEVHAICLNKSRLFAPDAGDLWEVFRSTGYPEISVDLAAWGLRWPEASGSEFIEFQSFENRAGDGIGVFLD